jgi:hypothetical protein
MPLNPSPPIVTNEVGIVTEVRGAPSKTVESIDALVINTSDVNVDIP